MKTLIKTTLIAAMLFASLTSVQAAPDSFPGFNPWLQEVVSQNN